MTDHKRIIALLLSAALFFYYTPIFTSSIKSKPIIKPLPELNPFDQPGRLIIDEKDLQNNQWLPLNVPASHLMASLYQARNSDLFEPENHSSSGDGMVIPDQAMQAQEFMEIGPEGGSEQESELNLGLELHWIVNKTILLLGDSVDRFFLKDFCHFNKGNLISVQNNHVASPPPFHYPADSGRNQINKRSEHAGGGMSKPEKRRVKEFRALQERREIQEHRERSINDQLMTNPWVCDLEELGFTIVSVFFFGVGGEGAEEHFGDDSPYHPPAKFNERIAKIAMPLLQNLAIFLKRPQIATPDLIQVHAGFWDLRKFSQEDFKSRGYHAPFPDNSDVLRPILSLEREKNWEGSIREILCDVANSFPGMSPILWRTMNIPRDSIFAPGHRVVALNTIARKLVDDMRQANTSLASRLILNDFEKNTIGTGEFYRDDLHPNAIPASWLNGDRLLWELKRATLG